MADKPISNNKEEQPIPIKIEGESSKEEFITREEAVAKSYFEEQMGWLKDRIGDTNFIMGIVVVVLAVGFITLFGVVATLVIDSFHFNSATYQEYSDRVSTLNDLQKTNNTLFQQISNQQKIIVEQQKEIESTKSGTH